jgi:hypothetical protein
MEENIKQYAQSLYDQAERSSLEELRKERKEIFRLRKKSADQPLGGTEISAMMACHVHHIERSLEAKLTAYQSAFAEGGVFPSEEDFTLSIGRYSAKAGTAHRLCSVCGQSIRFKQGRDES